MGRRDTVTKEYMSNNDMFADAFNYYVYGGRQVIDPGSLHEMDSTELAVIYEEEKEPDTDQRYRDVLKSAAVMADGARTYVILGIENQDKVHYAMPVKSGVYDALQYVKQIRKIAELHKELKDWKGHTDAEFLSGFYKEDRLTPVITLVLYFGSKRWDGPMSLREMMDEEDPELMRYVQDYRINLLQPVDLKEGDFRRFRTSLGTVLEFLRITGDPKELKEAMENGSLPAVPVDAARVIRECTGVDIRIPEGAEVINVCEAFDTILKEGVAEGEARGEVRGKMKNLYDLVRKGLLSLSVAAAEAGQSEAEFKAGMDAYHA